MLFFGIIAIFFIYKIIMLKELNNKHLVTTCTITNVVWGAKNSRFIINAEFNVGDKITSASTQPSCTNYNMNYLYNKLIGKRAIVIYEPTDINNNVLLLEEKMYKSFNLIMPDSLRWIDSLVSCK